VEKGGVLHQEKVERRNRLQGPQGIRRHFNSVRALKSEMWLRIYEMKKEETEKRRRMQTQAGGKEKIFSFSRNGSAQV